jgi:hypothetical protein
MRRAGWPKEGALSAGALIRIRTWPLVRREEFSLTRTRKMGRLPFVAAICWRTQGMIVPAGTRVCAWDETSAASKMAKNNRCVTGNLFTTSSVVRQSFVGALSSGFFRVAIRWALITVYGLNGHRANLVIDLPLGIYGHAI